MVKIILESATSAVNVTPYLIYGFLTIVTVYVTSTVLKFLAKKAKAAHWAKIAKQKRAQRDQQIEKLVVPTINISPQLEQKILNSDAVGLIEMLKSFETTSEEILITYFKRAITIGLDYQIITEINFEESLIKARECDKLRRDNPSACKGELFGLPITIKDSFVLKGTDASAGMACRVFKPSQEDGLVVRLLKGEGAIPYVKSNVPQAIMVTESNNHIWGQSDNPWQKGRGVGGSSGGEAAMIAGRLAPLGLGTDIAGSIRVPALHNGVVGFKPTAERLTLVGATPVCPTLRAFLNLKVAIGPIVKSVRDCNVLMKVLLNNPVFDKAKLTEQDAYYNRREWRDDIASSQPKKLRIGYFKSLDLFPACITSQRAVDESVQALKKLGHDVVEVKFPDMDDIVLTLLEVLSSEGNMQFLLDAVEGETPIEDYEKLRAGCSVPNVLRKPLATIFNLLGYKRAALMVERARKRTAYEFLRVVARHAETRKKFFATWEEYKLDALMSPGYGHPAQKHGIFKHIFLGAAYTWIYNVLNVPAGVIPVTLVKEGEDKYPREICKWKDNIYDKMVETMEGSVGMPMGVHIVTLPWQDEKCVSIMHQLEKELQFVKKHPFPI